MNPLARLQIWMGLDHGGFKAPSPIEKDQRDFHFGEYTQIRAEAVSLLTRIESLFRYSLIVTATVYAWLIVHTVGLLGPSVGVTCLKLPAQLLKYGWWIPPSFVFLAG